MCAWLLHWTSTENKEYLNTKKLVWKRVSKIYFFLDDWIPPASPAMRSNSKILLHGQKNLQSKIFIDTEYSDTWEYSEGLKNFDDSEYSETWEYSEGSKNFDDSEYYGEENSNSSEYSDTSENSDETKILMQFFVKWLFTFSHSGKKWTILFSLFLKIFASLDIQICCD